MRCPECQTELPDVAKFCLECGHRLEGTAALCTAHPTLDAERKRVTALFSDISGYTAMTSKLDPEEIQEITSRVFDGVRDIISKYEGFIERFAGDGVLALFGVPKAHEDDPIRAVHAAREIHELVKSLSPRYESKIGRPLSMHSGVNTGLAVTADVDPAKGTHGVTGDAINVAARLSDLAQAREILVGPDTHKACKNHFTFETLKPATVKGKSEPILVFKMLSAHVSAPHARAGRQVSSEMVGRGSELDRLELQVMKAINGEGSVVNVIGEAGIGKSRLIAELKKREVMKRVTLLEGRAISIGKNLSFHPVIDLLKQWARIAEDDLETKAFVKLEKAIRAVHPEEANEIIPFIGTLMGIKLTGKHAERVKGIEGEGLEKLILKNVRELVIKGSELRPSVIIMEDLHWADTSSIELLGSLYRLAEKYRIAFINVFRPGYFESDDGAVAKVGERHPVYYVEIQIQPLDENHSATLIDNMLEIRGLPYSLKAQIVERAGGNPFFIEEVVRSLIDEGAVIRKDGGFEVTEKIDSVVIPPTINDVLVARIDRLEEQTRELVKVASVIGRSFFDRIIKDVADSIGDVDDRLAYLKDVQIIRDRTRMQELEYLFKHALAQEAAYETTLIQQRKTLHLKVAQSIEKLFNDRLHEFYGMLAYHYSKGEDLEKAEEYLSKAGEEALRSSASSEALGYFQEALRLYITKSGEEIDDEKIGILEKYIALSFHAKGHYGIAVHYLDKVLQRWGVGSIRNKTRATVRLAGDLSIVVARAFLCREEGKQVPSVRELEVYDLKARLVSILAFVAPGRFFSECVAVARTGLRFDPDEVGSNFEPWLALSGLFAVSGLSFSLSKKFLQRAEATPNKCSYRRPLLYKAMQAAYIHCSGKWNEIGIYDKTSVGEAVRNGDLWDVINYIWFVGVVAGEQGRFQDVRSLIDELFEIAEEYEHDFGRVVCSLMRSALLVRTAKAHEAAMEADSLASRAAIGGFLASQLLNLGLKSVGQVMSGDIAGAQESMVRTQGLIDQQDRLAPVFKAPYLVGRLMLRIELLREAARSGHGRALSKYLRMRYQIGREALRNAARYAPYRTWILKLMGEYHWLIGKQRKAMKWWDRAIKEGERLGARPDLSRTYFEVGKRMQESQSKYKQLNGIDANGYLEKAGILFEEMGLERDLEDLERVRMGM